MIITLRELLSAKIFMNCEPATGEIGLDHKVTSLIILDGPSGYKYTLPDMLVITSGYFLSMENTTMQLELIKNLAACGVAGMAIKPNYFKDYKIPQPIVDQAKMLDFPIIILQNNLPSFRDILVFFDTSLYCRGSKSFINKEDLPTMFSQCINSESLPGLIKQLHMLSGLNVTTLFDQKKITYPSEHANDVFSRKISDFSNQIHIKPSQSFPGLLEFQCENAGTFGLGVEFGYKSNSSGSIWIDCSERAPDENDAILLKSAQLACKIETKLIINYQKEQERHRAQFIERLLSGQLHSWQDAVVLSMGLNWRIPRETQLLVISCADNADLYLDIDAAVRNFFKFKNEKVIVYPYQNYVVIFLPSQFTNQIGLCTELQTALEKRFPKDHFVFGLGRVASMKNAYISYEEAKYTVQIGKLINSSQTIHEFQKLGFYRLCCAAALPDEIFRFFNDYIGPLLELDKTTNLDLLNTLRIYFECQENFSRTGKELFLQPNAVRYRMEVIEKACNIDFKNHFDSLNVKLALYLMPIVSSVVTPASLRTIPDFLTHCSSHSM